MYSNKKKKDGGRFQIQSYEFTKQLCYHCTKVADNGFQRQQHPGEVDLSRRNMAPCTCGFTFRTRVLLTRLLPKTLLTAFI